MEWLNSLFFEHTPLQAVVILSIIIAVGLGLGKIHLFGISLGVTFVFFAGILAGHLGFSIDPNMLNYAESFGLVLFVYELGLQVGPGFFSSFRKGGVQAQYAGHRRYSDRYGHDGAFQQTGRHTDERYGRHPLWSHHQYSRSRGPPNRH